MSPRKSSTSSAERPQRSRYLGIEVAGVPYLPRPWLEQALARALPPRLPEGTARSPRVIRVERSRALVEVGHRWALEARTAWNAQLPGPSGRPVTVATRRTWGTLRDGKRWLRTSSGTTPAASTSNG